MRKPCSCWSPPLRSGAAAGAARTATDEPVTASANSWQLQNLPAPWSRVLLSRRPDLRAAIADHATLPKLQQALQQGAITRQELDWRMDQARARVDRLFQPGVPALQSTYAFWEAHGTTRRHHRSVPKRAIRQGAGRQRDIRASGDGRSVRSHRLPAQPRLQPVESPDTSGWTYSAATGPNPAGQASPSYRATCSRHCPTRCPHWRPGWKSPRRPLHGNCRRHRRRRPPIKLVAPDPSVPVIKPSIIRWDKFVTAPSQRTLLYPHDILGLPDGSLLFSAQVADNRGWNEYVWRLHAGNDGLQADEVWHGKDGPRRMMINGDGSAVWFDGQPDAKSKPCLYRYDLASRKVDRHEVVWPSETDWQDHQMSDLHWILDDDLPANFWHDIRHDEKDENPVGSAFLTVQRPASPPSDADDPWPFVTTLSSVRQSLMDEISNGSNALIWPVRWRPSGSYWTEDSTPAPPHAAYDRLTAALRHAGFLQRRRCRASLGSPQGQWIATGFAPARRRRKYPGPKRARFVGMHVVDLKSGHVLSALLGSANNEGRRSFRERTLPCDGHDLHHRRLEASRHTLGRRTGPHTRAARHIVDTQRQRDPGAGLFVERFGAVGTRHARTDAVAIARRTARSCDTWRCSGSIPQLKPWHRLAADLHDR